VFLLFSCGFLAHNEDIMRFRCGDVKSPTVFTEFLLKFFNFSIIFLGFGNVYAFLRWFFISNGMVVSLYVSRICMIGHLSMI